MKKVTNFFVRVVERYMPDPFIYAVILSAIIMLAGIFLNGETPFTMMGHWGGGIWSFLSFGMQMALVVILGEALAKAPLFEKILKSLASIPKTPKHAVMMVTFVSGVACMIQWGFGLIIGAIFAKEVAKRVKGVDYRLLLASAYCSFMLTITTCTVCLKAASNVEELTRVTNGVVTSVIPLAQTVYHPITIAILLLILFVTPLFNAMLHPSSENTVTIDPALLVDEEKEAPVPKDQMTFAQKLEHSPFISIFVFVFGACAIVNHFVIQGKSLDIDIMNLILLTLGILLHKKPIHYLNACAEATKSASGIILQFPFYAGIMGMMTGISPTGTSIANLVAGSMVNIATAHTLPLLAFTTAAILNFFVPSSGGLWAIQAPLMFPVAQALGVGYPIIVVAIALGETWTNLIQPFWAIPGLGIAGLKVKDIMGFCTMITIYMGFIQISLLGIWSFMG